MKTLYKTIYLSLSIAAISGTAFADEVKPDACAASLSSTGKTIFEAVRPTQISRNS